jgi:anionic cell wall polymer biosynthesis LytR-Cps2A-Psr (LCP) family protein
MTDGPPNDHAAVVELPPSGTGARARHRARRRRERRVQQAWVVSVMVVLAAAIPVLGYVGFQKVFNTTAGRRVDAQNDPSKPNYEANVTPTPVMLLGQGDATNGLTSLTMLSLGGGDTGGGVVFIPVKTVTNVLDTSASSSTTTSAPSKTTTTVPTKTTTLAASYAANGEKDLAQLTANVVGLSFDDFVVMSDDQLAAFVAPAAPLTIKNPDRLVEVDSKGKTTVVFAPGDLTLQAAEVPRYLGLRNPGESDLNRLSRQQLVWEAWFAAVKASSNPNVVPGETASGLGRFVRGLAKGNVQLSTLPVTAQNDSSGSESLLPDASRIGALMTAVVPLPTPASPGSRVRVRLLSGVGPVDVSKLLATPLVSLDSQITLVGNADRFDYASTEIVYYDDQFAASANALQQLLGVGQAIKSTTPADSEDVTVIIGKDLVDKRGLQITQGSGGG